MEIKVKIGVRIKILRELKGMSQKDLASECKTINVMIINVKNDFS